MSPTDAPSEAAAWHARLQRSDIDQASLADFRAWRARPGNDRAFRDVERLWSGAAALKDDPDIRDAVGRATKARRRRASHALWAGAGPAAAVALAIGVIVLRPEGSGGDVYETRIGQQSTTRLSDGSILRLDADSRVRVTLRPDRRAIVLDKGQALFDVAHDPTRPLVVSAGAVQVTALGTQFDVRRSQEDGVRVSLLRGRVRVSRTRAGPAQAWILEPGQALDTAAPRPVPRPVDADAATGWTTGRLVFHATPVAEAVAEANRYSPAPLELPADRRWTTVTVDGVFVAGDADALAQALSTLYGLTPSKRPDGSIVLRLGTAEARPRPG